jgi:hypothetical protein
MSQYACGGTSSKRIMINNSYAVSISEHFCFLLWSDLTGIHNLIHGMKPLGICGFQGLKRKQQTPVICIVCSALWFTKHFQISSQLILCTPVK